MALYTQIVMKEGINTWRILIPKNKNNLAKKKVHFQNNSCAVANAAGSLKVISISANRFLSPYSKFAISSFT